MSVTILVVAIRTCCPPIPMQHPNPPVKGTWAWPSRFGVTKAGLSKAGLSKARKGRRCWASSSPRNALAVSEATGEPEPSDAKGGERGDCSSQPPNPTNRPCRVMVEWVPWVSPRQ